MDLIRASWGAQQTPTLTTEVSGFEKASAVWGALVRDPASEGVSFACSLHSVAIGCWDPWSASVSDRAWTVYLDSVRMAVVSDRRLLCLVDFHCGTARLDLRVAWDLA